MLKKEAIFCCYHLPVYLQKSIFTFAEKYDFLCHVVCHLPISEAPFQLEKHLNIVYYEKKRFDARQLLNSFSSINPNIIFVAGWIEKDYIQIAKYFSKQNIPVVMGLDNHWTGTWKQSLGSIAYKLSIRRYFSHIWIPGKTQFEYAQRLNFKNEDIMWGLYSASLEHFKNGFDPHRIYRNILFVGRFVNYKRPVELYKLFKKLTTTKYQNWTLTMIGNGPCKTNLTPTDRINILPFVEPQHLIEHLKKASVFCLPSTREHWGVAVQENCAAGKLLLTSDHVGAAAEYVIHNYNGFTFKSNDLEDLENYLVKIFEMSDEELMQFQQNSFNFKHQYTLENWADQLYRKTI